MYCVVRPRARGWELPVARSTRVRACVRTGCPDGAYRCDESFSSFFARHSLCERYSQQDRIVAKTSRKGIALNVGISGDLFLRALKYISFF